MLVWTVAVTRTALSDCPPARRLKDLLFLRCALPRRSHRRDRALCNTHHYMSSVSLQSIVRQHQRARFRVFSLVALAAVAFSFVPYEMEHHKKTGLWIWQLPMFRSAPLSQRCECFAWVACSGP